MHDNDIAGALTTIAAAASTARLAPPEEIRRRGSLRRRRRMVAIGTSTVLTFAGAFAVAAGMAGQLIRQPTPAAANVTESALLRVADLEALEEPDAGWRQFAEPPKPAECAPTNLTAPIDTTRTLRRSFAIDNVYRLDQVVYDFPSAEAARNAFASESARVLECRPEGGEFTDAWRLEGVGDEAVMARFQAPDPDPESALAITVRLARSGQAMTSVVTSGQQQDWGLPDWKQLGAAVSRLCGPADGACVRNAKPVRTYPAPSDAPGFLQISDLPKISGDQWEAGPTHELGEIADFETVCDAGLLNRNPTKTARERVYFGAIGDQPAAVTVTEAIAGFPTTADALAYLEHHRTAYSNCTEWASGSLKPVAIDVGPHDVSAWSAPDLGIYVAAVAIDNTVVVVHAGADGEKIIDESAFHHLIIAALKRLG